MRCPSNQAAGKGLWEEAAAQGNSKQSVCLAPAALQLRNQQEGAVLSLHGSEKVKTLMHSGGQQAAAGVRRWPQAQTFVSLCEAGKLLPLPQNAGRKRGKDTDKHGQHWPTLTEKLDTPTASGILEGDFKAEQTQKPCSLSCLSQTLGPLGA